jgi:hypothetical protein
MTEPSDTASPDEPDALDELASAYLDGEATPDEVARVDSDPELLARVAALRAVGEAVGEPTVPPPGAADAAVARALATGDEVFGPASVVDLGRERRQREQRRTGLWVASAAAVIMLLAVGIPLLNQLSSSSSTDTAARTGEADQAESAEQPMAAEEDSGAAGAQSTTVPGGPAFESGNDVVFLGDFASEEDDLIDAVRQQSAGPRVETETQPAPDVAPTASPCPAQVGDLTDVVAIYAASVDGEPFSAVVYLESPDELAVVVVSADCDETIRADI